MTLQNKVHYDRRIKLVRAISTDTNGGKTMTTETEQGSRRRGGRWRIVVWTSAAIILLLALLANQFVEGAAWSPADFVFAGALLLGVCLTYEFLARTTANVAYRAAVGVAVAAAFILIWLSLSVGIIGRDGDPANLMYLGVLAVGAVGALIARLHPTGMARALFATALAQMSVALFALVAGLGYPWSGPLELSVLNGFFVALFLGSAWLFRRAARGRPDPATI
jgi:hypothetical protein